MQANQDGSHRVGLDLEGRITLTQLLEAAEALADILRDVDTQTTQRAGGGLDWVIADMRGGSAHLEVYAAPKDDRLPYRITEQVLRNFEQGMRIIAERSERPPYFTDNALKKARVLTALARQPGIEAVVVQLNGTRVSFDRRIDANVRDLVEGDLQTIGSVEGTLEMVTIRGAKHFNVYDEVTDKAVRCYFPDRLLEAVRQAFGQRVLVHGVFTVKRTGEVSSLKVEGMELFPDESELPTVDSIRGVLNRG